MLSTPELRLSLLVATELSSITLFLESSDLKFLDKRALCLLPLVPLEMDWRLVCRDVDAILRFSVASQTLVFKARRGIFPVLCC